ncbi:MAG: hypothetical protein WBA57_03925 [Elainellaceae cyanobacterium]
MERISTGAIACAAVGMAIATTALSGLLSPASAQDLRPPLEPEQPLLFAQQLVDGLPPPPLTPGDPSSFPVSPGAGSGAASGSASAGNDLFMVYVNGSSPLLLEQVRQVQPDALIQEYEGQPIILVGAYDSAVLAEQQILSLENQGISATVASVPNLVFEPQLPAGSGLSALPDLPPADENASFDATLPTATLPSTVPASTVSSPTVSSATLPSAQPAASPPAASLPTAALPSTPVSATPPSREIEFNPVPRVSSSVPPTPSAISTVNPAVNAVARVEPNPSDSSYYIVIPGEADELASVRQQILLLGARQDAVSQRDEPLGPHVLVGPFIDRQTASRWNRFLRDFGMNARVYYRR